MGPYMNKFNWKTLVNDARLNPAQKKTVNKIIISLQVPARNKFRNRPPLNFNIAGMTVPQVNSEVLKRLPKAKVYNTPNNVKVKKQSMANPIKEKQSNAAMALRQHREMYGE